MTGNHAKLQRPRSSRAHDQVLDSAIELFADRGIDGTSIDSIAAQSGVSKATIYKHWTDKNALAWKRWGGFTASIASRRNSIPATCCRISSIS